MKKTILLLAALLCLLIALPALADYSEVSFDDLRMSAAFPDEWTVITLDNVSEHYQLFDAPTPQMAADMLGSAGIYAVAVSPEGDALLRVIVREGDETARLYYDIERYTPAMRTAVKNDFLDRDAWALTGYRYTEAEWTNKEGQGRILQLTYSIRHGEEIVYRGRQAYTIRNGMAITLDLQVQGRRVTSEEERLFATFVSMTAFPSSQDMPLLPVGLTVSTVLPEETVKAELVVRGSTSPMAEVTAWVQGDEGEAVEVGRDTAGSGGTFRLDAVLPGEGEYRLFLVASKEGLADSEVAAWISYDANRLPVTFTSRPNGDYYESQVIVSGKTLSNVTIQCMEGDTNKKVVTGSDGLFSFKLDRDIVGERTVTLAMSRANYPERRFELTFNRQWRMEDYVAYLSGQIRSLSYANLTQNAEKYIGRLVRYTGQVTQVSNAGDRTYVQLALTQDRDGAWKDRIIAVADGMEVLLSEGDTATLYVEVTSDTYAFSELDEEGQEISLDLPSVTLLAYQRQP